MMTRNWKQLSLEVLAQLDAFSVAVVPLQSEQLPDVAEEKWELVSSDADLLRVPAGEILTAKKLRVWFWSVRLDPMITRPRGVVWAARDENGRVVVGLGRMVRAGALEMVQKAHAAMTGV